MRQGRIRGTCGVITLLWSACVCADASLPAESQRKIEAKQEMKQEVKQTTREVIDEMGRRVAVPLEVRRIVSLAPNLTEIVYALGAQDRLVGVSNYSDHPAAAKLKPRVGMPVNPSLEAIAGAHPDLVLITTAGNRRETADALARLGIAVYATNPNTVEGMFESIRHIGDVIGAASQAESLVTNLQERLNALKIKLANAPPVRVLFVVWEHPLISLGAHTFIADALRCAGAQSVVDTKQNWPQISLEEVVRLNPDYLVFASADSSEDAVANQLAELRGEAGWCELAAVREGHIAVISDEVDLPAPGLVDAIEQLARELHPNVFSETTRQHPERSPLASMLLPAGLCASLAQNLCAEAIRCVR